MGRGVPSVSFARSSEQGLLSLQAKRPRFTRSHRWIVCDANDRLLFFVRACSPDNTYEVVDDLEQVLFTIRITRESRFVFFSSLASIQVFRRDSDVVLYTGRMRRVLEAKNMMFYRGAQPSFANTVGRLNYQGHLSRRNALLVFDSADTALLLVASALAEAYF
eukprot:TRINITY_DN17581_c0_g1_i1.p2 TRINITY_DN17581_c0_g1~~TRINITY_DN17581_c0_g1_i1.p2  ORF type:complete len:163 (+),score=13.00 TRINITY_DN17581_c0_g1_i1:666-1154(+)